MTKIYNWKKYINEDEMNNVIKILKNGGTVILPTETVYGLAADASSDSACEKIFTAKGRAQDNPLIVHVCDNNMIKKVAQKPNDIEQKLIDAFMPGPFTLILNKKDIICDTVSCGNLTVGVRMPSNSIIHEVIEKSQIPLAAPSANISGRPSGTCIEDIQNEFEDKVDAIVDGGPCKIGIESTVVKVIDGIPEILRPGYITESDIKRVIGNVKISNKLFKKIAKNEKVESPGMKYRHYAPKTKCILIKSDNDKFEEGSLSNIEAKNLYSEIKINGNINFENMTQIEKVNAVIKNNPNCCILGFSEDRELIKIQSDKFICIGSKFNLEEISRNIFTELRKIDKMNCNLAIIEGVKRKELGLSIMNRLVRACENNII